MSGGVSAGQREGGRAREERGQLTLVAGAVNGLLEEAHALLRGGDVRGEPALVAHVACVQAVLFLDDALQNSVGLRAGSVQGKTERERRKTRQ